MDRRGFFRDLARRGGREVVRHVEQRVRRKAARWIRPPYALAEIEFLLACTRCGACIEACPHDVVFPLPARLGAEVAGTPALDLLDKPCRLCADWPCVAVCEPGALKRPGQTEADGDGSLPLPRLARVDIDRDHCLPWTGPECGACADACPVPGALVWSGPRPSIEAAQCTGCALCRAACVVDPPAITLRAREAAASA